MNPVPGYNVTTPYHARGAYWGCQRNSQGEGLHTGVDFAAPEGAPVYAARPGTVRHVYHGAAFGSHQFEIVCADGTSDFYAHMMQRLPHDGATVEGGTLLGLVGKEGNVSGPHLHFERLKKPGIWSCTNNMNPAESLEWQPPAPPYVISLMHASLQYRLSDRETSSDLEKIFERAERRKISWITGTEAGPGSGGTAALLTEIGLAHGYKLWIPRLALGGTIDGWIAVRESSLTSSRWVTEYVPVVEPSKVIYSKRGINPKGKPRWGEKGVVYASFDTEFGRNTVMTAHYLHKARKPGATYAGVNHWQLNKQIGQEIGDLAIATGNGSRLAWYGGDQNMNDGRNHQAQGDTFFGAPLTSCWDELEKWPNTGHGTIDVIASYNGDRRVSFLWARALPDSVVPLKMDHFLVEADVEIKPPKNR